MSAGSGHRPRLQNSLMHEAFLQLFFLMILIVLGVSGLGLLAHGVYRLLHQTTPKPEAQKVEFPKRKPPRPKPYERAA